MVTNEQTGTAKGSESELAIPPIRVETPSLKSGGHGSLVSPTGVAGEHLARDWADALPISSHECSSSYTDQRPQKGVGHVALACRVSLCCA